MNSVGRVIEKQFNVAGSLPSSSPRLPDIGDIKNTN